MLIFPVAVSILVTSPETNSPGGVLNPACARAEETANSEISNAIPMFGDFIAVSGLDQSAGVTV